MVEYNLLNILSGHKYLSGVDYLPESFYLFELKEVVETSNKVFKDNERTCLGGLLKQAVNDGLFADSFAKCLEEAFHKRNYYVHHLFKDDLKVNNMDRNPSIYLSGLSELISMMIEINEELLQIFRLFKEKAKQI